MWCKCWKKIWFYCIAIILLIVLLLVNTKLWMSVWNLEITKAGGKENWALMEKIYTNEDFIEQQTAAINSTIEQVKNLQFDSDEPSNGGTENTNTNVEQNIDASAVVEDLLANAPVRGNKDARFTIVEYTELLCPYCQRHSTNKTIESVMEAFPNEVNSVSRHYIIHGQTALDLSVAMECIGELNPSVYYDVFEKAFEAYPVSMEWLTDIAVNAGVNKNLLQTCIDEWRYVQAVENMMNIWYQVFGIRWTPGNVIYDRVSWKYQVLAWAYPAENFIDIIENMKKN